MDIQSSVHVGLLERTILYALSFRSFGRAYSSLTNFPDDLERRLSLDKPGDPFPYLPGSRWLYQARTHRQGKDLDAIMHQRVGFYVSKSGRLIAMGNYGVALDKKDDPNDGNGIGRVVREIKRTVPSAPFISFIITMRSMKRIPLILILNGVKTRSL